MLTAGNGLPYILLVGLLKENNGRTKIPKTNQTMDTDGLHHPQKPLCSLLPSASRYW